MVWLRRNGIDVLISLTESPLPRQWVNGAGLMVVNTPIPDMQAPSEKQVDHLVETIDKAKRSNMKVAVHCEAGLGRTGTILAAYMVTQGHSPREAISKVRSLRPGSIETIDQENAIELFAQRWATQK